MSGTKMLLFSEVLWNIKTEEGGGDDEEDSYPLSRKREITYAEVPGVDDDGCSKTDELESRNGALPTCGICDWQRRKCFSET